MRQSFRQIGPDRIQRRQGGGCLAIFGLPFFAVGVFMLLAMSGLANVSNSDSVSLPGRLGMLFMGLVFTAVGGTLSFGRGWTTIDSTRREVITQYGLMVPMHTRAQRVDEFNSVMLSFVQGDSDSADTFPVTLKSRTGHGLKLDSATQYGDARSYATAVADLLRLDFEDATTDHPVRRAVGQADMPLQQRLQMEGLQNEPARPPNARSEVTREGDGVQISIPNPRTHPFAIALTLIPVAISTAFVSPMFRFFRQTRTPDPVGWAFIGFMLLLFGVLPAMTALNGYLRSRRGRTIVTVSPRGIEIRERGAWRTGPANALPAAEILDIDFSTSESVSTAARVAAEQRVRASSGMHSTSPEIGPRTQWLLTTLSRYAQGHGIIIKTRQGLTTVGKGLADDETRYVHAIVRRALAGH
jgi:hypothetical protein